MKKTFAFILALVISAQVVSCSSAGNKDNETKDSGNDSNTVETSPLDKLGTHDFEGNEYVILSTNNGYGNQPNFTFEFLVGDTNGDVVNDAVFERQSKIEERYNVKLQNYTAESAQVISRTRQAVMSDDGTYSLICAPLYEITSLATGGSLANLYDFPEIDMTSPWWNQNARESLTVNGKIYLQTNFINTTGVLSAHCLFFNKVIAEKNSVEDLYDLVQNGKWTVDKMLEVTENVTTDLNGDTVYNDQDLYGFMASYGAAGIFHYGCDNPFIEISDDGVVTGMLKTERLKNTVDKLFKLCFDGNRSYVRPIPEEAKLATMFSNGQALIYGGFFFDMFSTFRNMNDDFGLLPYPKYDESQDKYYTAINGGAPLIGIPKVTSDSTLTGVITEALAIEGYESIRPAIVEKTIRNKLLRDDQSIEIYDMFFDGIKVELALVYRSTNDLFECVCNLLSNGSDDLFSYADSKEPAAVASYQKIIDSFYEN